ncbi:glycosyltransferase family protein [Sulfitobacter sp.]|uniref:glycosyltransferase family protein n=1 Tax=Sulfitobacter sp. TaxID=1903071 RepID=UPI0030032716
MKVMIVVTHLLGTGHLARALTLARAYIAAGDTLLVVSGGMPAPLLLRGDVSVVQLPPVRSDGVDFSRLLDADGSVVQETYLAERRDALLQAFAAFAPDILITELFPFGRRILKAEFIALLSAARALPQPPLVCASIRDILAPPSKPKKAVFADDMIAEFYDAALVHSDEDLTPLDLSWPVSERLRPFLRYTGFVAPAPATAHPAQTGLGEIIVSAGGGDVGGPVYEAAIAVAALTDRPMRLLVGGAFAHSRIEDLRRHAPAHVIVEAARPDFRQMLYHASASVSLCGYNTALDILQAGTPAVFVPFDEGGEVEQGLRATALATQSGIAALPRAELTAESLCATLDAVIADPRRPTNGTSFDGAARAVNFTHARRTNGN